MDAKIHHLFVFYKVDKEKVSDWFGIADLFRPIHTNNPKLVSAAKVIKIFQNPNVGQAYMIGNRKIISSIYMK